MLLASTQAGLVYVFDRPVRLLVADDDPIMRECALAQLSQPGATIVAVEDGEAAWEALEADPEPFDLLLSDLEMPRLGGFGLLERIRGSARHAGLPAVMITSRDDVFAIDRAYEVGATSFVAKPVNWRILGHQLRYVLRASRAEAEARAARAEAERAAGLKNRLLTLLQHETRTPLHAIKGYAELLRDAPLATAGLGSHVEHLLGAARDLEETLRRVFYFSQLVSGTVALDRETVPLGHLAAEAVHAVRGVCAAAGVGVVQEDRGGAHLEVSCDVRHLSIALKEILANAVAHAPRGSSVAVRLARSPGRAVLEVADDGPGMSQETLRRCEEPFGQEEDPLTRVAQGLGLGLPTARGIAERHGGEFSIASSLGAGTRVFLALPPAPAEPLRLAASPA